MKSRIGVRFIEAQYHGGVDVRDIRDITIIGSNFKTPQFAPDVIRSLKTNKIKLKWLDEETEQIKDVKIRPLRPIYNG